MLLGDVSRFFNISSAFSNAKISEDQLYLMVTSIRILPVTDPIFSHRDWDLDSSSKNSNDACLMGWSLLDSILIIVEMSIPFATIS